MKILEFDRILWPQFNCPRPSQWSLIWRLNARLMIKSKLLRATTWSPIPRYQLLGFKLASFKCWVWIGGPNHQGITHDSTSGLKFLGPHSSYFPQVGYLFAIGLNFVFRIVLSLAFDYFIILWVWVGLGSWLSFLYKEGSSSLRGELFIIFIFVLTYCFYFILFL